MSLFILGNTLKTKREKVAKGERVYDILVANSKAFALLTNVPLPTQQNLIENVVKNNLATKAEIEQWAHGTRPILNERVKSMMLAFLDTKNKVGTECEKKIYKGMKWQDLVLRLITKRPLAFYDDVDYFILRSGQKGAMTQKPGYDLVFDFKNINECNEAPRLPLLKDYISFDEMKLSALIGASSWTTFINDGARDNKGRIGVGSRDLPRGASSTYNEAGHWIKRGVIIGLVGARFERPGLMEWQDCVVAKKKVAGQPPAVGDSKLQFIKSVDDTDYFLSVKNYETRMSITFEIFLDESNERASEAHKKGFVLATGWGMGVWKIHDVQDEIFVFAFIKALHEKTIPNVKYVFMNWIEPGNALTDPIILNMLIKDCPFNGKGKVCIQRRSDPANPIYVYFGRRNPHDPINDLLNDGDHCLGDDTPQKKGIGEEVILIEGFAWDGNSFPGNEYWDGHLAGSGDPAAASSSLLPELHNVLINTSLSIDKARIKVFP